MNGLRKAGLGAPEDGSVEATGLEAATDVEMVREFERRGASLKIDLRNIPEEVLQAEVARRTLGSRRDDGPPKVGRGCTNAHHV